jgi:hypothetical protein
VIAHSEVGWGHVVDHRARADWHEARRVQFAMRSANLHDARGE